MARYPAAVLWQTEKNMRAIIVGAGVAGLTCARKLIAADWDVTVLEADDAVGGRLRTDKVDGFLLDRGFQILLTSYPEARAELNFDALQLRSYEPGALIRYRGTFHRFVDPWRAPKHALSSALSPLATMRDKIRIGLLRHRLRRKQLGDVKIQPDRATIDELRRLRFSERIIERFFKPFLGGIFLEPDLATSHRMFEFVFAMFIEGYAALPADGIQAIPMQLARFFPDKAVRLNTVVSAVSKDTVTLDSGERMTADAVIVATDAKAARKLVSESINDQCNGVSCLYYAADRPPLEEPILILNGDGEGPINNLSVPSQIVSSYAPPGKSLISVTVLDSLAGTTPVLEQLHDWFGDQVNGWELLRRYDIDFGLPALLPSDPEPVVMPPQHVTGVYLCGDHCDTSSLNGAIASGRRAAESILASAKS